MPQVKNLTIVDIRSVEKRADLIERELVVNFITQDYVAQVVHIWMRGESESNER